MFVYLVQLFNSPNEVRIAGGIFKINIICNEKRKERNERYRIISKIIQLKIYIFINKIFFCAKAFLKLE